MRETVRTARLIMAALAPIMGSRSSGTALVHATGANVLVKANTMAIPIVGAASGGAQIDPRRPVRVSANTTVTSAGTAVPVTSVIGGGGQNLPIGTRLRWDPPLDGVELTSALSVAMTGAAASTDLGAPKQIVIAEGIAPGSADKDLWQARATGGFPAAVLTWISSSDAEKAGNRLVTRKDTWVLTVIVTRLDSAEQRGAEGLDALDAIESELADLSTVDGAVLSSPAVELVSRDRIATTPTSFIYELRFKTTGMVQRIDRRAWPADWTKSRYDLGTATQPSLPVVVDDVQDMDPNTPLPGA